ncbi:MAG: S24/S26 family peptidase [Firmicutes bacterium]|nr:S24/S26 family peptidase [Bacillota bacterium]
MKKEVVTTKDLMRVVVETINNNQKATFKVTGSSMMPFFKHEETSVTVVKKEKAVRQYDVILFRYQGSYKLHRIIQMNEEYIVASGDALLSKEMIKVDDIIGIVESFEMNGITTYSSDKIYIKHVKRHLLLKPLIIRLRRFK